MDLSPPWVVHCSLGNMVWAGIRNERFIGTLSAGIWQISHFKSYKLPTLNIIKYRRAVPYIKLKSMLAYKYDISFSN